MGLNLIEFIFNPSDHPILINILCGFVASIVFIHYILWLYKPRIEIWPIIAKKADTFDKDVKMAYWFKIRNLSWFKAFDINVQLYEVVSVPSINGRRNSRHFELELKTNKFNYIAKRKSIIFADKYTDNCLIFRTYCDLQLILGDETKSVQIEVTLRHGLTGISGIYIQEFIGENIKAGFFSLAKKLQ